MLTSIDLIAGCGRGRQSVYSRLSDLYDRVKKGAMNIQLVLVLAKVVTHPEDLVCGPASRPPRRYCLAQVV